MTMMLCVCVMNICHGAANRISDIANICYGLNLPPEQLHHTETFFSTKYLNFFKSEYFMRRTKKDVNLCLPDMVVQDQRVPFTFTAGTWEDYDKRVKAMEFLAAEIGHWTDMASRRVPGAFVQMCIVRTQYQACITTLRVISAAPISWPFSKVQLGLNSVQAMIKNSC
jgi:hypothetical protein